MTAPHEARTWLARKVSPRPGRVVAVGLGLIGFGTLLVVLPPHEIWLTILFGLPGALVYATGILFLVDRRRAVLMMVAATTTGILLVIMLGLLVNHVILTAAGRTMPCAIIDQHDHMVGGGRRHGPAERWVKYTVDCPDGGRYTFDRPAVDRPGEPGNPDVVQMRVPPSSLFEADAAAGATASWHWGYLIAPIGTALVVGYAFWRRARPPVPGAHVSDVAPLKPPRRESTAAEGTGTLLPRRPARGRAITRVQLRSAAFPGSAEEEDEP